MAGSDNTESCNKSWEYNNKIYLYAQRYHFICRPLQPLTVYRLTDNFWCSILYYLRRDCLVSPFYTHLSDAEKSDSLRLKAFLPYLTCLTNWGEQDCNKKRNPIQFSDWKGVNSNLTRVICKGKVWEISDSRALHRWKAKHRSALDPYALPLQILLLVKRKSQNERRFRFFLFSSKTVAVLNAVLDLAKQQIVTFRYCKTSLYSPNWAEWMYSFYRVLKKFRKMFSKCNVSQYNTNNY